MSSPTLRAALFDLDGTLIETHIDFAAMTAAMDAMAQAAGVPEGVYAGKDILGMVEAAVEWTAARGSNGIEYRQRAFAELEAREVAGCAHPVLLPGTESLLRQLTARGVKVGIVTRNCRRVSVELLEAFRLPHDVLLTRDDVARTKPDPQHLRDALRRLDRAAADASMTGDHWMDIQAGRRAGVAITCGVLGNHDSDWFSPCPPDVLVRDLGDAEGFFH